MELENRTIGWYVGRAARKYGEGTAIDTGRWSCTFYQLDRITDILAVQLKKMGITEGTHTGIWSVNSPSWVILFLAIAKAGAVSVLISTSYKQEEMAGILNYADVDTLFYGDGYKSVSCREIISDIKEKTPKVRNFIYMEELVERARLKCSALRTEENAGMATEQFDSMQFDSSMPACMIFTSGTMSLPKGVILTHYNLVNNARAMAEAMKWGAGDKMCIALPLFHCFGITAGILSCITAGMTMYLIPYFRTKLVWEAIENCGCTVLNGVPSMFLALIRKSQYFNSNGERLKSGIIAGSPFTPKDYLEICRRFPNMHLQPAYGQTESSPCVAIARWEESRERKADFAGNVLEHIKVRIVVPETGEVCRVNEDGEIQVQGYNVMQGYYKLPKANQMAFTEDGWLKTGDIGRLDEKNHLRVTGRIKEIIIRGGENISPQEVEQVIGELDEVKEAKVMGIQDDIMQEKVLACISLGRSCEEKEQNMFKEKLLAYLESKLAGYKIPEYIFFLDAFPMTPSGKYDLKKIREIIEKECMK